MEDQKTTTFEKDVLIINLKQKIIQLEGQITSKDELIANLKNRIRDLLFTLENQ